MELTGTQILRIAESWYEVAEDVYEERIRQEKKFPNQVLPYRSAESTSRDYQRTADYWKAFNDRSMQLDKDNEDRPDNRGWLGWSTVLLEELHEAFAETDLVKMREELIQTAAVVFRIIAQVDRELSA